jgi:hypothetical protein
VSEDGFETVEILELTEAETTPGVAGHGCRNGLMADKDFFGIGRKAGAEMAFGLEA